MGDTDIAQENWHFIGPFQKMTFASRMQHAIYWGRLKRPLEWSLKTWLAPWAYIASVLYHDFYWYPWKSRRQMRNCIESPWGRLFHQWGKVPATAKGFPHLREETLPLDHSLTRNLKRTMRILATCLREAPELDALRRKRRHKIRR